MRHFHIIDVHTLTSRTYSRSENAIAALSHTKNKSRLVPCEYKSCSYDIRYAIIGQCVLVCFIREDCDVISYAFTRASVRLRAIHVTDGFKSKARRKFALAIAHHFLD